MIKTDHQNQGAKQFICKICEHFYIKIKSKAIIIIIIQYYNNFAADFIESPSTKLQLGNHKKSQTEVVQ